MKIKLNFILILAFVLRLLYFIYGNPILLPDSHEYLRVGKEFFKTGVINNYKMMPIYPIWAHISQSIFRAPILDILISTLTIYPIYGIIKRIKNDPKISMFGAILFAIYPISVYYASSNLTESLFVFLFLSGLCFCYNEKWIFGFVLWVLSILVRPTFEVFYPILLIAFSLFVYKFDYYHTFKLIIKFFIIYFIFLFPWWVHNYSIYNTFVRLNLGGGLILFEGNNPNNKNGGPFHITSLEAPFLANDNALELDQKFRSEALNFIKSSPKGFIKLSIKKFLRLWNIIPNHKEHRSTIALFVSLCSMVPLYVLSILYLIGINKDKLILLLPIIMSIAFLTLVHCVTVASVRYRYPIEPFLIIFASIYLGEKLVLKNYLFNKINSFE
jgi:Gpi18-like mannosyltransferase